MVRIIEFFSLAFSNLLKRKLRSWLTMIGIFIGIAAVVGLISLGQGLQQAIQAEFEKLGTDKIMVMPAGNVYNTDSSGEIPGKLFEDDEKVVQRVNGVKQTALINTKIAKVSWDKNDQGFYYIYGLPVTNHEAELANSLFNIDIIDGRALKSGDNFKAVIGYDYAHYDGFDKLLHVGDSVLINEHKFEIVGIKKRLGNQADDRSIIIPRDTFFSFFTIEKYPDMILVQINKESNPDTVADSIKKALRKNKDQKEGQETFAVKTLQEFLTSFLSILTIVQTVIIGIAAISLLVGAIGIMNTMYTAVLERRKEIGVMKAIGAKNSDVLFIFLIESGSLGLVGGIIGVLLGLGFSNFVALIGRKVLGSNLLVASAPLWLIIGALLFAFFIGMISGVFPAKQAAALKPAETLRYE